MKHIYTVFTIQDPTTLKIKYVGFTTQTLTKRFSDLRGSSKSKEFSGYYTALSEWLREMEANDLKPIVKSAFDSTDKQEAEDVFVDVFNQSISPDLLNRTIIRSGLNKGLQFKQFDKPIKSRRSVGKRVTESKSAARAIYLKTRSNESK